MSKFRASRGQLAIHGELIGPGGEIRGQISLNSPAGDYARGSFWRRLARFVPSEISHNGPTRDAICDTVVDLVDVGTLNSSGSIKLYSTNRQSLLSQIFLANPAFGAAQTGVAQALGLPVSDSIADASGFLAEFDLCDRDEQVILSGSAGTGENNEDMIFPTLEVVQQDIVKLNAIQYTAAP